MLILHILGSFLFEKNIMHKNYFINDIYGNQAASEFHKNIKFCFSRSSPCFFHPNNHFIIMNEKYKNILSEYNKFIKDEVTMIETGARLSSIQREIKPKEKELRN